MNKSHVPAPISETDAAPACGRAHPRARRRHGHDDPGAAARRGGFRGARFDAWNREVRGNNDLLNLTPAGRHSRHPSRLFPRRRRHRLDQYVLLDPHRAGRLRHGGDRLRAQRRRRAAGARSRAASRRTKTAANALSPARSARPTAPPRSRPTCPIPAFAPSRSTNCASPIPSKCAGCSTAASTRS